MMGSLQTIFRMKMPITWKIQVMMLKPKLIATPLFSLEPFLFQQPIIFN